MKALILFILGSLGVSSLPVPPDSLLTKVVLFKGVQDLEIGSTMTRGCPQATGFYLDTGKVMRTFVVTARHVVQTPDSVSGLRMHIVDASGQVYDEYLGDYRRSHAVITHPDFGVDVALLENPPRAHGEDSLSGFRICDILSREELQEIGTGSRAFYIGMCLDSIKSVNNVYSCPEGIWLETFDSGKLIVDSARQFYWKADFSLKISGTPGVSGSPVLMKKGSAYRLAGIVNGFGVDASGRIVDTAYCTAAYRILEALADTSKDRWLSNDKERPLPPRG